MLQKDKRAVSVMIGYVLLVSLAIIMGGVMYSWMKSYVPGDSLECPTEVSLIITDYDCVGNELNFTIKNNGNFNVAGYYIHGSENADIISTIDLSENLKNTGEVYKYQSAVLIQSVNENSFEPGEEVENVFELDQTIKSFEIIPVRWQEEENQLRFVSCGESSSYTEFIVCN